MRMSYEIPHNGPIGRRIQKLQPAGLPTRSPRRGKNVSEAPHASLSGHNHLAGPLCRFFAEQDARDRAQLRRAELSRAFRQAGWPARRGRTLMGRPFPRGAGKGMRTEGHHSMRGCEIPQSGWAGFASGFSTATSTASAPNTSPAVRAYRGTAPSAASCSALPSHSAGFRARHTSPALRPPDGPLGGHPSARLHTFTPEAGVQEPSVSGLVGGDNWGRAGMLGVARLARGRRGVAPYTAASFFGGDVNA